MIAIDTNVLVRLVTNDDHGQAKRARSLVESQPVWIAKTVLLETYWVLRRTYEMPADEMVDTLTKLCGLPGVLVEDAVSTAAALKLTVEGVDFADALHLVSRPSGSPFVSFDRAFVRRAKRAGMDDVMTVPLGH